MYKSKTYNGFIRNISFFIHRKFLNKERNITSKPVISVWFVHFSTYFYHLVRFTKIYHLPYIYIYIYRTPPHNRTLSVVNSEFSFFSTVCYTKSKELSLPYYLLIAGRRIAFITFPNAKYKQLHLGFELGSPCPFPTTITITSRVHAYIYIYIYICIFKTMLIEYRRTKKSLIKITNHLLVDVFIERQIEWRVKKIVLTQSVFFYLSVSTSRKYRKKRVSFDTYIEHTDRMWRNDIRTRFF